MVKVLKDLHRTPHLECGVDHATKCCTFTDVENIQCCIGCHGHVPRQGHSRLGVKGEGRSEWNNLSDKEWLDIPAPQEAYTFSKIDLPAMLYPTSTNEERDVFWQYSAAILVPSFERHHCANSQGALFDL